MSWADQSSQAETPEGRALVEQVGMDTYTKEMAQTAPHRGRSPRLPDGRPQQGDRRPSGGRPVPPPGRERVMARRAYSGIVNMGGSMSLNGVAVGDGATIVVNGKTVEVAADDDTTTTSAGDEAGTSGK
ncbi:hypothetical protein [Nonomuraea salmonea]|uniref:hypothetical protein n=1 Tax=Nonomuraea salmonea TaxID=46181 RepID=UPI002FEB029D